MRRGLFLLLALVNMLTAVPALPSNTEIDADMAFNRYARSVFQVLPQLPDMSQSYPTGVATLIHPAGFVLSTMHSTPFNPDMGYILRQPSDINAGSIREFKAERVTQTDVRSGHVSILQIVDPSWNENLVVNVPPLCLELTGNERFNGTYIHFDSESGLRDRRTFRSSSATDFKAEGVGVQGGDSGSLALRDNQMGIGVVEGHIDHRMDWSNVTLDDLRAALAEASRFQVLYLGLDENVRSLWALPTAPLAELIEQRKAAFLTGDEKAFANLGGDYPTLLRTAFAQNYPGGGFEALQVLSSLISAELICAAHPISNVELLVQEAFDFRKDQCIGPKATEVILDELAAYRSDWQGYCADQLASGYRASPLPLDSASSANTSAEKEMRIDDTPSSEFGAVAQSTDPQNGDAAKGFPLELVAGISRDISDGYAAEEAFGAPSEAWQRRLRDTLDIVESAVAAVDATGAPSDSSLLAEVLANGAELALALPGDSGVETALAMLDRSHALDPEPETVALQAVAKLRISDFSGAFASAAEASVFSGSPIRRAELQRLQTDIATAFAASLAMHPARTLPEIIRFGVSETATAEALTAQKCLSNNLRWATGGRYAFEFVSVASQQEVEAQLTTGDLDLAALSGAAFASLTLAKPQLLYPLVAPVGAYGESGDFISFIARRDGGVRSVSDLKGGSLGVLNGPQMAPNENRDEWRVLTTAAAPVGLPDPSDFTAEYFSDIHVSDDNIDVMQSLMDGRVDAAMVMTSGTGSWDSGFDSGPLAEMSASGAVDMSDFVELGRSQPIPVGPIVSHNALSPEARTAALAAFTATDPASVANCVPFSYLGHDARGGYRPVTVDDYSIFFTSE